MINGYKNGGKVALQRINGGGKQLSVVLSKKSGAQGLELDQVKNGIIRNSLCKRCVSTDSQNNQTTGHFASAPTRTTTRNFGHRRFFASHDSALVVVHEDEYGSRNLSHSIQNSVISENLPMKTSINAIPNTDNIQSPFANVEIDKLLRNAFPVLVPDDVRKLDSTKTAPSEENGQEDMDTNSTEMNEIQKSDNSKINASSVFNGKLTIAITTKNIPAAMELLSELEQTKRTQQQSKIQVRLEHLVHLLALTSNQGDLQSSCKVLRKISYYAGDAQGHQEKPNSETSGVEAEKEQLQQSHLIPISTYVKMCESIDKYEAPQSRKRDMVVYLFKHFKSLDFKNYQQQILPTFFIHVLSMPHNPLKHLVIPIWEYMEKKQIERPDSILEKMLQFSFLNNGSLRGNKTLGSRYAGSLPFDRVLVQLVDKGIRPKPNLVDNTLMNTYPFMNAFETLRILKSIKKLYEMKTDTDLVEDGSVKTTQVKSSGREYRISFGTLELVTAASAKLGDVKLMLFVWDLLDLMGYRANESIYENAIQTFIRAHKKDHHAFAVISEMEANDHTPSRAVIQNVGKELSYSIGRANNAYYILTNGTEGTKVSTSSFNCILSAFANLGHVNHAFSTYEEFSHYGIQPNADTFSYLMEALATDLMLSSSADDQNSVKKQHSPFSVPGSQMEAADAVYVMMSHTQIELNEHIIHHHVRILIFSSELEKAMKLVREAVDKKEIVSFKTLELLALNFIDSGDAERSQEICGLMRKMAKENCGGKKFLRDVVPIHLTKKIEAIGKKTDKAISRVETK